MTGPLDLAATFGVVVGAIVSTIVLCGYALRAPQYLSRRFRKIDPLSLLNHLSPKWGPAEGYPQDDVARNRRAVLTGNAVMIVGALAALADDLSSGGRVPIGPPAYLILATILAGLAVFLIEIFRGDRYNTRVVMEAERKQAESHYF